MHQVCIIPSFGERYLSSGKPRASLLLRCCCQLNQIGWCCCGLELGAAHTARTTRTAHTLAPSTSTHRRCVCTAAVLFSSIREECERMGVNERVLISDEAGRQFYVPPLRSTDS